MTKITPPGSAKDALDRAVGILSRKRAAGIIDRSESYLYELANPDSHKSVRLDDALALDYACKAEVGETPFTTFMRLAIEAVDATPSCGVAHGLLKTQVALGDLAKVVMDHGHKMTMTERKAAHDVGQQLLVDVEEIIRALAYESRAKADTEAAKE